MNWIPEDDEQEGGLAELVFIITVIVGLIIIC
jgi:hypothetical protein